MINIKEIIKITYKACLVLGNNVGKKEGKLFTNNN